MSIITDKFIEEVILTVLRSEAGAGALLSARKVGQIMDLDPRQMQPVLVAAVERGFLEVVTHLPSEKLLVPELERQLFDEYEQYGLREVYLVPGFPGGDLSDQRMVLSKIARRTADYIERKAKLHRKDAYKIACSWGRALREVADHLVERKHIREPHPNLVVMPALGFTDVVNGHYLEANVIAVEIARAFGGAFLNLATPAFVPEYQIPVLKQQRVVREMLEDTLPSADLVVTSLGPVCDGMRVTTDEKQNSILSADALQADGAIAEINYNLLGSSGEPISTNFSTVGLHLSDLRKIASNVNKGVVLAGGADPRCYAGIRAAILGGCASVLVTDTTCARNLIASARHARGEYEEE